MLLSAHRTERLVHVHCCPECQAQDTTHPVIQTFLIILSGKNTLLIWLSKIICIVYALAGRHLLADPCTELHIKTSPDSLIGVMAAGPVGHDHSVKAPLPLQDVIDQISVMTAVRASEKVVARHHAPRTTFLYGHLEGRKIYLPQRSLTDLDISLVAMPLLIVAGIMLHTRTHTL